MRSDAPYTGTDAEAAGRTAYFEATRPPRPNLVVMPVLPLRARREQELAEVDAAIIRASTILKQLLRTRRQLRGEA